MSMTERVGVRQARKEARQKRHSQRKLWRMHGARNVFAMLAWGLLLATFVGMTIRHLRAPDPVASFKQQIENPDEEAARLKAQKEAEVARNGTAPAAR